MRGLPVKWLFYLFLVNRLVFNMCILQVTLSTANAIIVASTLATLQVSLACTAAPSHPTPPLHPQITATANAVMQKHHIPGMAIVFVKDGKIAFEKGFGITKITDGTAVNTSTLFKVGSISKSITAAALALLMQDGKLKWDDPLSLHIPELEAANPAVARLTIRQVLSHQTKLDLDRLEPLLWPQPNQFKFENIVLGLKVLAEDARISGVFSYSNLNYALAGEVVRRASKVSYGTYVQREIFAPLKMRCVVHNNNTDHVKSVAQPHVRVDGVTYIVRADPIEGAITEGLDAAAGGVRCDANAMGKWLQFQLKPQSSALRVTDALWRDLHRAQAAVRTDFDAALKPTMIETYGLGLQIVADAGEIRYDHYGGVAGMLAYFAVSPSHNSGFAVLLNMGDGAARKALIDDLSLLMRGKTIPRRALASKAAAVPTALAKRKPLDPNAAAAYFGRYEDPWFGEVSLCASASTSTGGATFDSQSSLRFQGKLVFDEQQRLIVLWDDKAINSDAFLLSAETRDAKIQRFTLKPVGESDFDFGAMRFRRIGECP
ncbi:serine hydrolase domain-containing protein [Undibacterium sp.]|uniref:serine hydrolase domain-containing protein n=1 Tax=Undibacterium sp. TaxID=1914977 RepID=UPI003753BF3A